MPQKNPHPSLIVPKPNPVQIAQAVLSLFAPSRKADAMIDAMFHGEAAPVSYLPLYTTDERVAKSLYRNPSSWSTFGVVAVLDCDGKQFEGNGKFLAASCCAAALFAYDALKGRSAYLRRFFP